MRTLAAVALLVALGACGAKQAAAPSPLAPLSPDAPAADVYARAMELVRTAAVAPATGRYAGPFTPQVGPSHALYQACAGQRAFDMIWWEFPTPAKPRRLKTPAGDYVVGRWEGGGTHTGPAFSDFLIGSLPAKTGRKMHFTGTTVLRIENGKVKEEIGLDDGVTALQQLGLLKAA